MVNMKVLKNLWRQSPPLMVTTVVMLVAFVASVMAMALDPRQIGGVSAWLKPAKFAISSAIFTGTVSWIYGYLTVSERLLRRLAWLFTGVILLEVGIIDIQAARGTTSHFNATTPLNAALFSVMGIAIACLWVGTMLLFRVLMKQRFADAGWGWALRLGVLISVAGSGIGGLMTQPTSDQIAAMKAHQTVTALGAHTVGGPDGGAGLPGVGWSLDHGDLRIPHFLGLHAMQAIPLLAFLFRRRRSAMKLVFLASGSYFGLTAILTWQALRGESFVRPGSATLAAVGVWLTATILSTIAVQISGQAHDSRAHIFHS